MVKKVLSILCLVCLLSACSAQKVENYDKNGERLKTLAEFVDVSLINKPKQPGAESVFGGLLLGPVYTIISSTIQEQLKRQEQKFVATYGNSAVFSYEALNQPGNKHLKIRRYAINSMDDIDADHLVAEYDLPITVNDHEIMIELNSILMKRAKARYKNKDHLALSIHIAASIIDQNNPPLGAGTIVVPVFKLTGKVQDFTPYNQKINKIVLPNPGLSGTGNIKLSVLVTESNIAHLEPSRVQKIISNNSEDVRAILKTIFGQD